MNDLDNWLNSLENSSNTENPPTVSDNTPAPPESAQPLSEEDFDDILNDFGFSHPENIQAEEITEEEEVYDENMGEGRDLDAEEDAAWEEAIASRSVVPVGTDLNSMEEGVHFHMPNGEVIDVPIITEEAHEDTPTVSENNLSQEEQLPLNSPTLLLDESTTRFSGAEWFNEIQKKHIIVAGQGGIGRMKNFL